MCMCKARRGTMPSYGLEPHCYASCCIVARWVHQSSAHGAPAVSAAVVAHVLTPSTKPPLFSCPTVRSGALAPHLSISPGGPTDKQGMLRMSFVAPGCSAVSSRLIRRKSDSMMRWVEEHRYGVGAGMWAVIFHIILFHIILLSYYLPCLRSLCPIFSPSFISSLLPTFIFRQHDMKESSGLDTRECMSDSMCWRTARTLPRLHELLFWRWKLGACLYVERRGGRCKLARLSAVSWSMLLRVIVSKDHSAQGEMH